ncbi:hypothetical protein RJT34_13217 [Clitoria ternatea]|uniref:Leucine zipper with capping helix domain-containing protein n=1 Tax=Clitoria ternatea TaxID=43366 RepID=A0AAN9PK08_CLITE
MFKDVWDTLTKNSPKDPKEFKDELEIEYDEDVRVSLQSYNDLLEHAKKQPRGKVMDEANDEFLMYAVKFRNKERPTHVTCQVRNVRGQGLIIMMPSNEIGVARNASVMLVEEELAKLSKDEGIL